MGGRRFEDFEVGQAAHLERRIEGRDVAAFVELTGDDNPAHVDDDYAREIGLGGRVAHGMLTAGYVSAVIGTLLPGPGALWLSERFDFRAPVRIGDLIRVEVCVRHISPAARVLVLDVRVANQHGTTVMDGEARVQFHERSADMGADRARQVDTVVVTGSSRGIGAAIAHRLAAEGKQVVLNYVRDEVGAEKTRNSIVEAGGQASVCRADISEPEQAAALIRHAVDTYGPVDALVNNAGGPIRPRPLAETRWEDLECHLRTHLKGSFLCVEATLPAMMARRFGRIVNISSQSAYGLPPAGMTGYVVAKAALTAFTKCVALEAGPHGVTANAVAPGMADTELVAHVSQRAKMVEASQAPLRRLTEPEDVAEVVSFLLSPGASHLTGQTLHVSAGGLMS